MDCNQKKECLICNNYFDIRCSHHKYCSKKCYKRAYYLRNKIEILTKQKHKYRTDYNYKLMRIKSNKKYYNQPINKLKKKEYNMLYIKSEKGKILKKKEYQKNRQKYLDYAKKYRLKNPNKIKISQNKTMQKETSKAKHRISDEKYRIKLNKLENQRRFRLGLPLIGEGYMREKELKTFLDTVMFDMGVHYDNKFWRLETNKLIRASSRTGLQLDRYYPDDNLAFEYDGRQHFEFVPLIHKEKKNFINQKK